MKFRIVGIPFTINSQLLSLNNSYLYVCIDPLLLETLRNAYGYVSSLLLTGIYESNELGFEILSPQYIGVA